MREASLSRLRVAARLANGFALDQVKLGGNGRQVLDSLLMAAIGQANAANIARDPDLQRRYATFDTMPPAHLMRPVSVNAVASSLCIPFETARRRVVNLSEGKGVEVTPKGLLLRRGLLVSPSYRRYAEANYGLVRTLYLRLKALQLLDHIPRAPAAFDPSAPPVRLVVRLSSDYVLRLAEPVTRHLGDFVAALIMMDVVQANTEDLPDDESGLDLTPDGYVADHHRRPARVAALARRTNVPAETVRRHLARLVSEDRLERTPEGYIAPARVLSRAPFVRFMMDNRVSVQRLFESLGENGLLAAWDLETADLRGAA